MLEKTETTEVLSEPVIELTKVNFDIRFSEVGDKATYKVILKNESSKTYEISNETKYSADNYIKYEFSYDGGNVIKAGEIKNMYVLISYNKEVPEASYTEGKYVVNKSVVVDIVNDTVTVSVPNTVKNSVIKGVALVTTIIVIIALLILVKSKKKALVIVLSLALIPVTIYAYEKISIEIKTKIEIEKDPVRIVYAINTNQIIPSTSMLQDIENTFNSCAETGSSVCLKYKIKNNLVIDSEVCFIKNSEEHCLLNPINDEINVANINFLNSIFNGVDEACEQAGNIYNCTDNSILATTHVSSGVQAVSGSFTCRIDTYDTNKSYCGTYYPVA